MRPDGKAEERILYRQCFRGLNFDFRGKMVFTRFDGCEFVECTLLVDHETEQLTFTKCILKDCTIDKLEQDKKSRLVR
jgi:hypothetical protein